MPCVSGVGHDAPRFHASMHSPGTQQYTEEAMGRGECIHAFPPVHAFPPIHAFPPSMHSPPSMRSCNPLPAHLISPDTCCG